MTYSLSSQGAHNRKLSLLNEKIAKIEFFLGEICFMDLTVLMCLMVAGRQKRKYVAWKGTI